MQFIDIKIEDGDFELYCPFCGHKLSPPEYPYCKHILFVHLSGCNDDFFDFISADFAELYINKLKKSDLFESSDYELSEADIPCELYDEIIDDEVIPMGKTAIVISITESESITYYPGKAIYCISIES